MNKRNVLFVGVLVLIVLLAVELLGAITWSVYEGRLVYPRNIQAYLKDVNSTRRRDKNVQKLQSGYRAPHRIIHPYVGYENPNAPIETVDLPTTNYPNELCVLITGGSVAEHLMSMTERMEQKLSEATGQTAKVINVAVGGYKQPQQLNSLTYLITLGYTCDVVVNLDGFNEYDLVFDNAEDGQNPWYPYKRLWSFPVGELRDMRAGALAWDILARQDRRESLAGFLHGTPFGRSYLLTFAWKTWDNMQFDAIEDLRLEIEAQQSQGAYNLAADGPEYNPDVNVLMPKSAELWARSSHLMHEVATAHDMQYLHFLQPNQYIPGSKPLMGATEKRVATNEPRHTEYVPQAYEFFLKESAALKEDGVRFYDMTQVFVDVAERTYRDIDTHLNKLGNEILSDAIVEEVLKVL